MSRKEKSPMEQALDHIWSKMYPGTNWDYPMQVAAHAAAVFREYDDKNRKLRKRVKELKSQITNHKG